MAPKPPGAHYRVTIFVAIFLVGAISVHAQTPIPTNTAVIGDGWHPWYEVKADPVTSTNLIVCGTKWDSAHNSPFGFVYVSSDGGTTWRVALEDRATGWVTEHSCAFGRNHEAYFISAAATMIDGMPQGELGATRLFVSHDGGQHWNQTISTGWADYSTSAVSSASRRLYTFFNYWNTAEWDNKWGSSIGLLVFAPNGKQVDGPYFDSAMRTSDYSGVFPSDALTLKNGTVVAVYYGLRKVGSEAVADLGIVRADDSQLPSVRSTIVANPAVGGADCDTLSDHSLAYDYELNRLILVYADGCHGKNLIMLTSSDDSGSTWTKSVAIAELSSNRRAFAPSLVVCPGGILGLLWEEGETRHSGRWMFSHIRDHRLLQPPLQLSRGLDRYEVSNDTLRSSLSQSKNTEGRESDGPSDSAALTVYSQLNAVWKVSGLIASSSNVRAVWASGDESGMRLYTRSLGPSGSTERPWSSADGQITGGTDVTRDTAILYGGTQHFDASTETLRVCVRVANRGGKAIRTPIELQAMEIRSGAGSVSILNATNGLTAAGAMWDISSSVTGDRIPPGTTSAPFCLSFRVDISRKDGSPPRRDDLLALKMRILASRQKGEN
jgi:FlaG/FlaF family flagellin (archaellin)